VAEMMLWETLELYLLLAVASGSILVLALAMGVEPSCW
jgi:hypothetical protein